MTALDASQSDNEAALAIEALRAIALFDFTNPGRRFVAESASSHIAGLAKLAGAGAAQAWCLVVGTGAALSEIQKRVEREGNAWESSMGRAIELVRRRALEQDHVRALIRPPVWPVAGVSNIVMPLVLGEPTSVLRQVPDADMESVWKLACHVEQCAWGTLWSKLSGATGSEDDPFGPILKLAEQGVYPVGNLGAVLVLFSYDRLP